MVLSDEARTFHGCYESRLLEIVCAGSGPNGVKKLL